MEKKASVGAHLLMRGKHRCSHACAKFVEVDVCDETGKVPGEACLLDRGKICSVYEMELIRRKEA